ncbi:hypothetical protein FF36_06209, partial [Frankia torreyi]
MGCVLVGLKFVGLWFGGRTACAEDSGTDRQAAFRCADVGVIRAKNVSHPLQRLGVQGTCLL